MKLKYLLAWIPMTFIAIVNGILREYTYGGHLSDLTAHQVSTVILLILFGVYIWGLSRVWRFRSGFQAVSVGLVWLVLTVTFEFSFGRFVAGHPWNVLLNDYNIFSGRLWLLVPAWIAAGPLWIFSGRRVPACQVRSAAVTRSQLRTRPRWVGTDENPGHRVVYCARILAVRSDAALNGAHAGTTPSCPNWRGS